jgi:hypothetical protein
MDGKLYVPSFPWLRRSRISTEEYELSADITYGTTTIFASMICGQHGHLQRNDATALNVARDLGGLHLSDEAGHP